VLPDPLEVPLAGFGYPLSGVLALSHFGSLFQLPTLLGFPLQSFAPLKWSKKGLPFSFPLLPFWPKPLRPRPGAPAAFSHLGAVLLLRPEGLAPVGAYMLSWGFAPCGSSPRSTKKRLSLSPLFSLSFFSFPPPYEDGNPEPQGLSFERVGSLPPKRAPTRRAFPTDCRSPPFKRSDLSRTIFSSRAPLSSCKERGGSLCDRSPSA
jgi:hypothetical protein